MSVTILASVFLGSAMAAVSNALGLMTRRREPLIGVNNFVMFRRHCSRRVHAARVVARMDPGSLTVQSCRLDARGISPGSGSGWRSGSQYPYPGTSGAACPGLWMACHPCIPGVPALPMSRGVWRMRALASLSHELPGSFVTA